MAEGLFVNLVDFYLGLGGKSDFGRDGEQIFSGVKNISHGGTDHESGRIVGKYC